MVYVEPTHAIRFLLAFSPFLRRPLLAGSSFRIGTPLPSLVSTRIGPCSWGGGVGSDPKNESACFAISRFICSKVRTDWPRPRISFTDSRASPYGPFTHRCWSQPCST
jgi:hypothetical protein